MPKLGKNSKYNWTKFFETATTLVDLPAALPGPGLRKVLFSLEEPSPDHEDWNEQDAWLANFKSVRCRVETCLEGKFNSSSTAGGYPLGAWPASIFFFKGTIEDVGRLEEKGGDGNQHWSLNTPLPHFFRRAPFTMQTHGIPTVVEITAPSGSLRAGEGLALLLQVEPLTPNAERSARAKLVWDLDFWSMRRAL